MSGHQFLTMLLALVPWLAACQRSGTEKPPAIAQNMARYATLPLLATAHHGELRDELSRIVAEKGTPAALNGGHAGDSGLVRELKEVFPAEARQTLSRKLLAAYPGGVLEAVPLLRDDANRLLDNSADRRRRYQRLMLRGELPLAHDHACGVAADLSYIHLVEVGNRLEAAYISQLLAAGRLPSVREPLVVMSQAIEWLAREKHLVPRLEAAERRVEWLLAVSAVANHPHADQATRDWLCEFLSGVLQRWPADGEAWIGERAQGMLTYELVRDGYLLSLIPYEDLRKYREEIGVQQLGKLVSERLDADEWFYLRTMRKIIQACDEPYYRRQELWRDVESEMERLRSSELYPFVADQMLLVDVDENQRLQSLDRARCEAWRLALSLATGHAASDPVINSVTGTPFAVHVAGDGVSVGPIDPRDSSSMAVIRK